MSKTTLLYESSLKLGFQISKEPTLVGTFTQVLNEKWRAYQLYLKSGRGYGEAKASLEDVLQAREILKQHYIYACIHGCLLYNFCGSPILQDDPAFTYKRGRSIEGLISELDIAAGMGCGVVIHPGSCKHREMGIEEIGRNLTICLQTSTSFSEECADRLGITQEKFQRSRRIILENSAAEGTKLASTLQEIRDIIYAVEEDVRNQLTVCIDTAHIFGAGQYDFGKPEEVIRFYSDFEKIIGLSRLEVFHLNDSKAPFGSRKDRHDSVGTNHIWGASERKEGLIEFLRQAETRGIPLIGEPPESKHITWNNIENVYPLYVKKE